MFGVCFFLDCYEWIKYGICDGWDEDVYYDVFVDLLNEVNVLEL